MTTGTESDIKELKDLITALREDIKRLEVGQAEIRGDLKALSVKIDGLDNRLEKLETSHKNQIWSLIIVLSDTLLGIAAKVFFISSKP